MSPFSTASKAQAAPALEDLNSSALEVDTASPQVQHGLRSPGQPLDPPTRAWMESRFQHDFSGVRVHTDDQAAQSARAVNARAYTLGQDVVFDANQYAPQTADGRRLVAHELTHVVQQGGKSRADTSPAINADSRHEQTAQQAASTVMSGGYVSNIGSAPHAIQRESWLERKQRELRESYENTKTQLVDAGTTIKNKAVELKDETVSTAKAEVAIVQQKLETTKAEVVQTVGELRQKGAQVVTKAEAKLEQAKQVATEVKQKAVAAGKQVASQVKKRAGERFMEGLGTVKGVILEGATIIDTVIWLQSVADSLTEKGITLAADKARQKGIKIPFSNDQLIAAFRTFHGHIPENFSVSEKFSGWADEKAANAQQSLGIQDDRFIFTSYELGELEGAVGTQVGLAFVGVEEVQIGLKVIGALGGVKTIVETIEKSPNWKTDPALYVAIFNTVLSVVGLNKAAAGKKIVQIAAHSASAVNLVPPLWKLYQDYKNPELAKDSTKRDQVLAKDMAAVVKAGKDVVMAIVNNPRAAKPAEEGGAPSPSTQSAPAEPTAAPTAAAPVPEAPVAAPARPSVPVEAPTPAAPAPVAAKPPPAAAPAVKPAIASETQVPGVPQTEAPMSAPRATPKPSAPPKPMPSFEEITAGAKPANDNAQAPAAKPAVAPVDENVLGGKAANDNAETPTAKPAVAPVDESMLGGKAANDNAEAPTAKPAIAPVDESMLGGKAANDN